MITEYKVTKPIMNIIKMTPIITVNVVSESEFFPKAHGVHSAYINMIELLKTHGVKVSINSFKKGADITHIHTIGPFSLYQLLTNKPTVVTAHVVPDSFVGSLVGAKYWYGASAVYLRFFYNRANLVLAVAPKVKEALIKLGVKRRIEIFPNVIDTSVFEESRILRTQGRKKLGLSMNEKVIIGVGQMQSRKGIDTFVRVAKEFPNFIFVWVGGKPFKGLVDQNRALKDALKNKPKNILFTGIVGYEEMPTLLNAADVFFFPSFQENAPMAPIEAAACGLPLVLRNLDEYKLLYQEGYFLANSDENFAKHIEKLFTNRAYYSLAKKNAINLSKKFSFETLGELLLGYYQTLL